MSRQPSHLRVVADALRAAVRAITADFAGLDDHVGPRTWEGPAAAEARRRAVGLARSAAGVCAGLRSAADRLDEEADAIEARERAEVEAWTQAAAMAEADRVRWERARVAPPTFSYGPGPSAGSPGSLDDLLRREGPWPTQA